MVHIGSTPNLPIPIREVNVTGTKAMTANHIWMKQDLLYFPRSTELNVNLLQPGIYKLIATDIGLALEYQSDKFNFDYKVYDFSENFINRVVKTWNSLEGVCNLGVLLSGLKGTGKSVTSKLLANKLNLPIIIIDRCYTGFADFINDIQQEVVVYIDEFEKIFASNSSDDDNANSSTTRLLSLLDGTSTANYKRLYLFTSNSRWVNTNLLNRPSRILYHKKFGNLNEDAVRLIVSDILLDKSLIESVTGLVKQFEVISVDTVSKFVREINIHHGEQTDLLELLEDMNLDLLVTKYKITRQVVNPDGSYGEVEPVGKYTERQINYKDFEPYHEGYDFRLGRKYQGEIKEVISFNEIIVQKNEEKIENKLVVYPKYLYTIEPVYETEFESYTRAIRQKRYLSGDDD